MTTSVPSARVVFPEIQGRRSTAAVGRAVITEALAAADPESAQAAQSEPNWRSGYGRHFLATTRLAGHSARDAFEMASAGLDALMSQMRLQTASGDEPLDLSAGHAANPVDTTQIPARLGAARHGSPELSIPYRGEVLTGVALRDQMSRWVETGIVEPAFAEAIAAVAAAPDALALPGKTVVLLGAGAAMGPLPYLTRWGADIVAVDVPVAAVQDRIARTAQKGHARVIQPVVRSRHCPGISLSEEITDLQCWLDQILDGTSTPVVAGMFYADGGTHVELTAASIALVEALRRDRPELGVAYLATPTDSFLVPADAVAQAQARWDDSAWNGRGHAIAHRLSGGRLFARAYPDSLANDGDTAWGVVNTLVDVQGPNYALAKRAQRWHAITTAARGSVVSANVAPSAWTPSVTKNRTLAAAFRGADRFGVEIFEPPTAASLMAAKLAADLAGLTPQPPTNPEALLSHDAAHGGLWRQPFAPLSALQVSALVGVVTRRPERL